MTSSTPDSARRGQRVLRAVFLVVAAWFAISSTWQITQSALLTPPDPTSTP